MDARGWLAFWDGHFSYGVREGLTQNRYVVSLLAKTCSCNAWQLSGVPCNHAVAAIWKAKELPEHYVSHYFSKDTYLKAYQFPLEPLNGPQEWPQSPYSPVIAPVVKKLQHRPTVKRKPSVGEVIGTRLSKKGVIMKCSKCREAGHNKNKCTMKEPVLAAPKAPTKRKQVGSSNPPTQQSNIMLPMHNRGVGVYTYPSGYQRQATVMSILLCFSKFGLINFVS